MNPRKRGRLKGYWTASRSPLYSWLFLASWLVGYELLSVALGKSFGPVRNGVELLFKRPFVAMGVRGDLGMLVLTVAAVGALLWRSRPRQQRKLLFHWFPWMFLESVVYAVVIGTTLGRATRLFFQTGGLQALPNPAARFALAIGAGAYEEMLFRAILLGGGLWILEKVFALPRTSALVAAVAFSTILFATAHYVGVMGDPFTPASFVYRLLAGLAFAGVYLLRGVGIAAGSHSLYNVLLFLHG